MAIASVAYASLHVIREWQKYGDMAAGYRPGWITGDPNYYSLSALLCVPLAYYMLRTKPSVWERWFCIGTLIVTLLGLTLAASRGGFLGLAAAVLMMAFRSKHRLRALAIAGVVILPLLALAPSSPLARLLNPDRSDRESTEHRKILARAGLDLFWAHPLTGIGPGNFKAALAQTGELTEFNVAHNTYISVMAEMGIPGILLFTGVIIATFTSLARVRRMGRARGLVFATATAEALEVGLVGFLVAAYFLSAEMHRFFWLMVFMSMVLPPLVEPTQGRTTSPLGAHEPSPNTPIHPMTAAR
jgi:O-antigen ligase